MKGGFISIEADVKEAQKALSGTSKSLPAIERKVLAAASKGTVKVIKGMIRQTTQRQTGELLKAYRYKVKKNGSASVYPKGMKDDTKLILAKASFLSHGGTVQTKRAKWLQVSGKGYYARPKEVTVAPRGFIQAGERYVETGGYSSEVQKVVDRELQKYWGD